MAAASIFQKLLRSQSQSSTTRLIMSHLKTTSTAAAATHHPPVITHHPPVITHHPPVITPPFNTQFLAQPKSEDANLFKPTQSSQIYPSFSFGYLLNPASLAGSIPSDADGVVLNESEEDSKTIWADSVKKKRKRKMNKHKLKKLRKSLRRKT